MNDQVNMNVGEWIEYLEKKGRNTFSLCQLEEELPNYSGAAIKSALKRLLKERNTESGYLKVSSPVLTASDLVQFEKRSGGITRVATVLNELVEEMDPSEFNTVFFETTSFKRRIDRDRESII